MQKAHITAFDARGTEVLVYYPAGSKREQSAMLLNFTAPNFIVYGDKTKYTEEEAAAFIESVGLDRAAANGGGLVILIQGKGDGWEASELEAYDHVLACMQPDTAAKNEFGIGIGRNFFTRAEEKRIVGFPGCAHLVGVGKGADFVGKVMLRALPLMRERKPGAMVSPDHSPASVLLVNASEVPTVDASVIPGAEGYQVPLRVSALNCAEGTAKALSVLGVGRWAVMESGCILEGMAALVNGFNARYVRQAEQLLPMPVWEQEGVICRTETRTVPAAPGNFAVKGLTHDITYR